LASHVHMDISDGSDGNMDISSCLAATS
jgi:hypothetical protein